jgi:hypothetical protein
VFNRENTKETKPTEAGKMTARITIDDRFFEIAAAQSSRYPRLWTIAKETIQNSQDAGASTIEFTTDGGWVTIEDNGPGMKPTGGIANFLTIGASEKNVNGSATGFFSTAKVRICFIHKDWQIESNDEFLSKGMLGKKSIKRLKSPVEGCRIKIESSNGDWDTEDIANYVALCNPNISVRLNGRTLRRTYRRGTLKAQFDWADIYVNRGKKALTGRLVVRVNGLAMFTQTLPGVRAQVTVEMDPQMSHRVLQENREGLVWSTRLEDGGPRAYPENSLREFVNGLIINPSRAKTRDRTVIEFIEGSRRAVRKLESRFDDGSKPEWAANQTQVAVKGQPPRTLSVEEVAGLLDEGFAYVAEGRGRPVEMGDGTTKWLVIDDEGERYCSTMPEDVILAIYQDPQDVGEVAGGDATIVSAPKDKGRGPNSSTAFLEIFPYDYVIKHEGNRPRHHTRHARLLKAWRGICEVVATSSSIDTNWGVGLLVEQEAKAAFLETEYGDYLMVDYRAAKSTGNQMTEMLKLARLAAHELTHAKGLGDHNERFLNEEALIFEAALENLTDLRAAAKGLTIYSRGYGK